MRGIRVRNKMRSFIDEDDEQELALQEMDFQDMMEEYKFHAERTMKNYDSMSREDRDLAKEDDIWW